MTDESELQAFRRQKDEFFRTDDELSPIPPEQRDAFSGLSYYPPEPSLAFEVTPEPFDEVEPVMMQTSDADQRTYERWAQLRFTVEGQDLALTIYRDPESGELFLPFQDETSGQETYGAGRYLELPVLEDGSVLLDFNYAYHPFCAYNPHYSCPLPPAENRLPVPIRAGECNPEAQAEALEADLRAALLALDASGRYQRHYAAEWVLARRGPSGA